MYIGYMARALALPGDPDALKEHAWCNFEFLLARLHSSSVHALLNDLDLTLASVLDADVHLVLKAVASSTRVLATDALQLASELIGRLRQLTGELQCHMLAGGGRASLFLTYCYCSVSSEDLVV